MSFFRSKNFKTWTRYRFSFFMAGFDVIFSAFYILITSTILTALSCIIRQRLLLWKIKTCLILDKSKRLPSKVDQGMLNDLRAKFVELKLKQLLFEDLLKSIEANADIFKSEIWNYSLLKLGSVIFCRHIAIKHFQQKTTIHMEIQFENIFTFFYKMYTRE